MNCTHLELAPTTGDFRSLDIIVCRLLPKDILLAEARYASS